LYLNGFRFTNDTTRQGLTTNYPSLNFCLLEIIDGCCTFEGAIRGAFIHDHHLQHLSILFRRDGHGINGHGDCASRSVIAFAKCFPALEVFHFDCYDADVPILGIDTFQPLFSCSHLTDLSLKGIQLITITELIRLMTAFPKLRKLMLFGPRYKEVRDHYQDDTDNDLEEFPVLVSRHEMPGLNLEYISSIQAHSPDLNELGLSLVANPTKNLVQARSAFPKLEKLDFFASFPNFRLDGFDSREAARFISSFLHPECEFRFPLDSSLREEFDPPEEGEPDQPWVTYADDYDQFGEQFRAMVEVGIAARSDERTRIAEATSMVACNTVSH